jgi:hypothetical protein
MNAIVSNWGSFVDWAKMHADEITPATAVIGLAVGVVGFGFTIWQLHLTQTALKATNTYSIQKDAREIAARLQNDPNVRGYVLEHEDGKS